MATLFAASHPDRMRLPGPRRRRDVSSANEDDWLWGDGTPEEFEAAMADWSRWGDGRRHHDISQPSLAERPIGDLAWWGRLQLQSGATPGRSRPTCGPRSARIPGRSSRRSRVPTLVVHRTRRSRRRMSSRVATWTAHIPGAKYVELPGTVHLPMGRRRRHPRRDRGVRDRRAPARRAGPTARDGPVQRHRRLDRARPRSSATDDWTRPPVAATTTQIRRELAGATGASRSIRPGTASSPRSTGRPGRSRCATGPPRRRRSRSGSASASACTPERSIGAVRQGLGGIAVHIGARVASLADRGETLVSSTVRDLTAGSGLAFEDRGLHMLKGVPGEWRIYAAV